MTGPAWIPKDPPLNAHGPQRPRQPGVARLIEAVHEAEEQPDRWGQVQHVYQRNQHATVMNHARSLRRGYLPVAARPGEPAITVKASGKGEQRYLAMPRCEVVVATTDDGKYESIYLRVLRENADG